MFLNFSEVLYSLFAYVKYYYWTENSWFTSKKAKIFISDIILQIQQILY